MSEILILGAGSLGGNLALNLLADTDENITVLDFDEVEMRNIGTGIQPYNKDQIGLPKVFALQNIAYVDFAKELKIVNNKLDKDNLNLLTGYDLVIDCFDNVYSRKLVKDYFDCPTELGSCLHVGFSGLKTFTISWDVNYKVPEKDSGIDICEMSGARSFIRNVASLTSIVVQKYLKGGVKLEIFGNPLYHHIIDN